MEQNRQPDILICMSDQHGGDYMGWHEPLLETPVLDKMKNEGVLFTNAYTPCPLCVPARMSFMSSLLPEHTGVYDNSFTLSNTIPCFTHALVEAGYETVLIGRMHFIGQDQRHGFTKRLAPDITPVGWAKPFQKIVSERGKTVRAFSSAGATDLVGAGASIVNEYDQMVVEKALEYLAQDHEKPQFILVGTFGPHFPYIADDKLYEKYLGRVSVPERFSTDLLSEDILKHPVLRHKVKDEKVTPEIAKACLAAYYANIEEMDGRIGMIEETFSKYTERTGHERNFGYLSDHGDTAGERRMYGKQTYYEKSAKVPLIFTGDGIIKDKAVSEPVSLLDIGPTLCELAGAAIIPDTDGRSLKEYMVSHEDRLEPKMVISQMVDDIEGTLFASVMLRYDRYKFTCYHNCEDKATLIDLNNDPLEEDNLITSDPKIMEFYNDYVKQHIDFAFMEKDYVKNRRTSELLKKYELATGINDKERWKENSEEARGNLRITSVDRIQTTKNW